MSVKKSAKLFMLIPVLVVLSSCEEDMSHKGMHQNYDTDRYKPNYSEEYAAVPPQRIDGNQSYSDDVDYDSINRNGLSGYVNDAVTPKLPCDYRHIAPGDVADFDTAKECIPYNKDQYGKDGGAQLAAFIKQAEGKGTAAKKAAF
jgi:hypothetical protein